MFKILIILFGIYLYLNVIDGKFVWDDNPFIAENVYVGGGGSGLLKIFTSDIGTGSGMRFNYYRPLQISSYKLEHALWGFDPRGYHITNIALHILVALCVFYLAFLFFGDRLFAFLAGLLFVSHPIQTETVAYISNRGDLLCAFFFMFSFIFYIHYIKYKSTSLYPLMIISYLFALFSKENALMFIGVLLIYHYAFKEKIRIRPFLPLFGVTIIYIFLRSIILKSALPKITGINAIFSRVPGFFSAVAGYLKLLFLPFGLHFDYGNKTFQFTDPRVILGIIFVFLLIMYAVANRKKNAAIFFSACWFLAMLIPVSNIYPKTAFYMAEHHLYLPSMGFAFISAHYLLRLYRKGPFKAAAICIITALLVFYGYLTIRQNNYWLKPVDFYRRTLEFSPDSAVAYYNLGKEYERKNDNVDAILMYKKTIELELGYDNAYNNLGVIYSRLDNKKEALEMFNKALEINPKSAPAYTNLGILYYGLGRKEEALAFLKRALEVKPEHAIADYNLAVIYYYQKQYGLAVTHYDRAVKLGYRVSPELLKLLQPYRK
ncbi:MAG: tetratricopeptide repeat protein [Candidatus Omnitrophota bacterium]